MTTRKFKDLVYLSLGLDRKLKERFAKYCYRKQMSRSEGIRKGMILLMKVER